MTTIMWNSILRSPHPLMRTFATSSTLLRHAPVTKKPRKPAYARKRLLVLSMPSHPPAHPTTQLLWKDCPRHEEMIQQELNSVPNDFEQLFVDEFKAFLQKSKVIAIFHNNIIKARPERKAFQEGRRAGLEMKKYTRKMALAALKGTKWESLMFFWDTGLFNFDQFVFFGEEVNIKKLLQLDKKIPEMLLLGAIVEDRFLNKGQLQDYAKLPPMDLQHAELSTLLQMSAQMTSSILDRNQQTLVQNLSQLIKDKTPE